MRGLEKQEFKVTTLLGKLTVRRADPEEERGRDSRGQAVGEEQRRTGTEGN